MSKVPGCKNLLTGNIYGKVACAEASTGDLLKACAVRNFFFLDSHCAVRF